MSRPANPQPRLKRGYWIVRIQGKDHHLGKDQRKAMVKFHRMMADRLSGGIVPGRPTTVAGVAEVWIRQHPSTFTKRWLRQFIEFAGREHLDSVSLDLLHNFHDHLLRSTYRRRDMNGALYGDSKPYKARTVGQYLKGAVCVMRLAAKRRWCEMPDVPKTAKPGFVDRGTERVELWRKLDAIEGPAGRILRFIAATGCRPGEAINLEWSHVHLDHRVCVLPEHKTAAKTGEPRVLALTDEAIAELRSVPRADGARVFPNLSGGSYTVTRVWALSRKHLGINTYALRHTFAQSCIDDGIAPETVTKLLGHKTSDMVWTYAKIRDRQLVGAAQTLRIRRRA